MFGGEEMDLREKLHILASAAKYDVSCASSGSKRRNTPGGLGNAARAAMGICHSWSADGRCISLLKILYTNYCVHNCAYCINRRSNDLPRAAFTPEEVRELTIKFYRRNYIEGLFLSSGVLKTADYTMELLIRTVKDLRQKDNFNGYIHLKVIPGADPLLVREAGFYADRLSVNIELPSERSLKLLAPGKDREAILQPMTYINEQIIANQEEKKKFKWAKAFSPAGQSTQLIVGATPESDLQILKLAEGLYKKMGLKRVYYSAFIPVATSPLLPAIKAPPLRREHRLYQADWLLRFYGFRADELLETKTPFLDEDLDPKTVWALRNLEFFPVEVNRASYRMLLRVPGIGEQSARKIISARRWGTLGFSELAKLGVVMKRARFFITCRGSFLEKLDNEEKIRARLLAGLKKKESLAGRQLPLDFGAALEPYGGG
jgi:putative DNA modification/repair radical SAM protein